ncbi:MAG: dihydropteroate synthase [Bacteroidota bacterium]
MSIFLRKFTLNCRGQLLDLSSPKVMGILNLTPDSFHDGGRYHQIDHALRQAEKMLEEGVAIIDIGGMSSRPGAELISVDEELARVLPVLDKIIDTFPEAIISIDTIRSEVATRSLEIGAHIINDISAGKFDQELFKIVAKFQAPYILMHMQGRPNDMQAKPDYTEVVTDLVDFFVQKIRTLRQLGVKDIIIDPGFGFGKTVAHNFTILQNLNAFSILNLPILAGVSRKSMICKVLRVKPEEALNGTTALHMAALINGASILRAHDVKEANETISLWRHLENP